MTRSKTATALILLASALALGSACDIKQAKKFSDDLDKASASFSTSAQQFGNQVGVASDAGGVAEAAANVAAPFLPAPWNLLLPGLVGLGAGLVRSSKNKTIATDLIKAIEAVKTDHGIVNFDDVNTKTSLDVRMGKAAKKLVDSVQAGKTTLPF